LAAKGHLFQVFLAKSLEIEGTACGARHQDVQASPARPSETTGPSRWNPIARLVA
jgi:hypothetical protein